MQLNQLLLCEPPLLAGSGAGRLGSVGPDECDLQAPSCISVAKALFCCVDPRHASEPGTRHNMVP